MTTRVGSLPSGLDASAVRERRERDGRNVVPPPPRTPAWRLLVAQLTHFFAGMLWVAALLSMGAFLTVMVQGGWRYGDAAPASLLETGAVGTRAAGTGARVAGPVG